MKVVTSAEMRAIEQKAEQQGIALASLMQNAGQALAERALALAGPREGLQVLVLAGPGNNGGDGIVAATRLLEQGVQVSVYLWRREDSAQPSSADLAQRGTPVCSAAQDPDRNWLNQALGRADLVLDALLGMGQDRPPEGELLAIVEAVNRARQERAGQVRVIAVDVPTGTDSDRGQVLGTAIDADVTITMGAPKRGLFLFPAAARVGEVVVADIGIPGELFDDIQVELLDRTVGESALPTRRPTAHKVEVGRLLVIAGSINYVGAAALAVAGALRAGAGLVTLACPRSVFSILAAKVTEATFLPLPEYDAGELAPEGVKYVREKLGDYRGLVLGCGLGQEKGTVDFVHRLLGVEKIAAKPAMGFRASAAEEPASPEAAELPTGVLDADALNALSGVADWWRGLRGSFVLTPHAGEIARLLDTDAASVLSDPIERVREAAERWGQTVVLKGALGVIASPGGRVWLNARPNPGLATAGTGDVLAGAIGALLAQGLGTTEAALLGVYIHSEAGARARQRHGTLGMVAGDLPLLVADVLREMER